MRTVALASWLAALALPLAAAPPERWPAAHFANAGGLESPLLSPDGGRVAGTVRSDTLRALLIRGVDGSEPRVLYRLDRPDVDLELLRWLDSERLLMRVINNQAGKIEGERLPISRLLVIEVNGTKPRLLVDGAANHWINHQSSEVPQACPDPDVVLLPVRRNETEHRVEGVHVRSGKIDNSARLMHGGIQVNWWADAQRRVRLAERLEGDGKRSWLLRQPEGAGLGSWQLWRSLTSTEADRVELLGFDSDAQQLLVEQFDAGRWTLQRLRLDDAQAPAERLLVLPAGERVERLLRHEGDCRAVGVDTGRQQHFWGDDLQNLLGGIAQALPGQDWQLRQWQAGGRYLVHSRSATAPTDNMVGNRKTGTLGSVAWSHERLPVDLGLQSRRLPDGAELLLPREADAARPLVVCLECELNPRDQERGFAPLAAMLATRGYLVLRQPLPDDQGSLLQLGRTLPARLEAQVQALVDEGLVQPERMAVIGGHSGGYLALRWAQQREKPLRAIVGLGALSDLRRYVANAMLPNRSAGYRDQVLRLLEQRRGTELDADSPLSQAGRTRAATLLLHGDVDGRIEVAHSRELVKALAGLGIAHELVEFANSDSQLDHPPYRRQAYEAIEAWLAKHL